MKKNPGGQISQKYFNQAFWGELQALCLGKAGYCSSAEEYYPYREVQQWQSGGLIAVRVLLSSNEKGLVTSDGRMNGTKYKEIIKNLNPQTGVNDNTGAALEEVSKTMFIL